ncbi:MAG: CHAP domain-containing protein [Clostridiales bacterium]|nr:CHAP domain-containing protein [Clostridiales bacterium]
MNGRRARWLVVGIVLMMVLAGTAYIAATAEEERLISSDVEAEASQGETILSTGESPDFVRRLLEVAAGEIGYTEGANNRTKYGEWAGDPNAAWCAEFVCWCVDQTDRRYGLSLLNTAYPNYSGQNTGRDWFIARGRFVYRKGNCPEWGYQWLRGSDRLMKKNDYVPRPGDLVFFSYNEAGDTEHVALVEYAARSAAGAVILHVIEGNNPGAVQRNSYYLDNSQILGFGACEDVVDTTIRSGCSGDKVRRLQQWLYQLGFLEERHITGTCGGNTKAAVIAYQKTMAGKTANGIADRETQQAIEADISRMEFDTTENWLVDGD